MIGAEEFHIAAADTPIGLGWMMLRASLRSMQAAGAALADDFENWGPAVAPGELHRPSVNVVFETPHCVGHTVFIGQAKQALLGGAQ